jgi:hypothetical protein
VVAVPQVAARNKDGCEAAVCGSIHSDSGIRCDAEASDERLPVVWLAI